MHVYIGDNNTKYEPLGYAGRPGHVVGVLRDPWIPGRFRPVSSAAGHYSHV